MIFMSFMVRKIEICDTPASRRQPISCDEYRSLNWCGGELRDKKARGVTGVIPNTQFPKEQMGHGAMTINPGME